MSIICAINSVMSRGSSRSPVGSYLSAHTNGFTSNTGQNFGNAAWIVPQVALGIEVDEQHVGLGATRHQGCQRSAERFEHHALARTGALHHDHAVA